MLLTHIITKKCHKLDFKGIFDNFRPFLFVLFKRLIHKQNSTPNFAEKVKDLMAQDPLLQMCKNILEAFSKFDRFFIQDKEYFLSYFNFLTYYIFNVDLHFALKKYIIRLFQHFLVFILNQEDSKEIYQVIQMQNKAYSIFGKLCKSLLMSQSSEESLLLSNILNIYTKILDRKYISNLLVRNLNKLNRLVNAQDPASIAKAVSESKLVVEILVSYGNVHQDRAVFVGSINLASSLLKLKKRETSRTGFQILQNLLKNSYHTFYNRIESAFKVTL